eukprot:506322-Amphidinium_carterae.2
MVLQSDGEPAMISFKDAVRMQAVDLELILRESPVGDVGDHQANGAAESVLRRVKDMARTQVMGPERPHATGMPSCCLLSRTVQ